MNAINNEIVAANILQVRKHKGIKATEMANELKLSESAYTKYERGETAITIQFLTSVARKLGVHPLYFLSSSPENIVSNLDKPSSLFSQHQFSLPTESAMYLLSQLQTKDEVIKEQIEIIKKLTFRSILAESHRSG